MPKAKRAPIDYKTQFTNDIFRPKEVVEGELAEIQTQAEASQDERTVDRSNERTSERSNEHPNVRTNERTKIRHSFDIYQDQLLALAEIQAAIFKKTGRKPKVGDLVQEALDGYIQREVSNERTNERSSERTKK